MAVYNIARYPRDFELRNGARIVMRPMARSDGAALLAFFKQVPEEERFLLKDDVSSPAVIQGWVDHLDYDRALPLLALGGERIVADAVLIRRRGGSRAHMAEIRVVVAPESRGCGIGVRLIQELCEIANDAELEKAVFEFVKDVEDDAVKAVEVLGAMPAGSAPDLVKDIHGYPHDLLFYTLPLGRWWKWSQF